MPRVVWLRYQAEPGEEVTFDNPPPLSWEMPEFRGTLEDSVLKLELTNAYDTAEEAQAAVAPYLRAWEIDVALQINRPGLYFRFLNAKLQASHSQTGITHVEAHDVITTASIAWTHVSWEKYPKPPADFLASADVEALWYHYDAYRQGKEPLLMMGYFCLTVLQWRAGGRKAAARKYSVREDVLNQLGTLTSTRGDHQTARKLDHDSTLTPLSLQETAWLLAVIPVLIRRVGAVALDPNRSWTQLTMSDFP